MINYALYYNKNVVYIIQSKIYCVFHTWVTVWELISNKFANQNLFMDEILSSCSQKRATSSKKYTKKFILQTPRQHAFCFLLANTLMNLFLSCPLAHCVKQYKQTETPFDTVW